MLHYMFYLHAKLLHSPTVKCVVVFLASRCDFATDFSLFLLPLQTSEKEHLLREQTELEQNLEQIRYSLCELCKNVNAESSSDQDHLQSLTQLSQSTSSSSLVDKYEAAQLSNVTLDSSACDLSKLPAASSETGVSEAKPQTEESVSEQSCPDPMSLLKDCLDMDSIL